MTMDSVTAANAAASREIASLAVPRATCNRCGSNLVAWVTSAKTGKRYLADATLCPIPGKVLPAKHRPHFKTCTPKEG